MQEIEKESIIRMKLMTKIVTVKKNTAKESENLDKKEDNKVAKVCKTYS